MVLFPEKLIAVTTVIDVLGIAGLGIGFGDLNITHDNDNSLIAIDSSDLAVLQGVEAHSLSANNFVFV